MSFCSKKADQNEFTAGWLGLQGRIFAGFIACFEGFSRDFDDFSIRFSCQAASAAELLRGKAELHFWVKEQEVLAIPGGANGWISAP